MGDTLGAARRAVRSMLKQAGCARLTENNAKKKEFVLRVFHESTAVIAATAST
jgi:hypothetical protein